ncbi:MAG TPA: TlpA disulfide reductase family protein [Conexibacter sp.]|nr:TlpA disulfide reductase family protein [Conexibacter sp.]
MTALLLLARVALAATFALAAAAKLTDRDGGRTALRDFGAPARLVAPLALALPLAELALAALLLPAATAPLAALAALALLALFTAALVRALHAGRAPACNCFGALSTRPLGRGALVRNGLLGALAAAVAADGLLADGRAPSLAAVSLSGTAVLALAGGAAVALLLSAGAWFGFELLRQNGRLLRRIEQLEEIVGARGESAIADGRAAAADAEPAPVASVEDLVLAAANGAPVAVGELAQDGRPLLLVFSDPACGPCRALVPDVAAWQREEAGAKVVLVSRGAASDALAHAQEHGVERLLLDPGNAVADALSVIGTPSAVLLDAAGALHAPVAGAAAIRELVAAVRGGDADAAPLLAIHHVAASDSDDDSAVGRPAPSIDLPGLDGPVRSADLAGRETLVLFWNPACGYCERMRDDLRALDRRAATGDGPRLLVVSTADEEANRALGLSSPVAFDDGFATGHAFGAAGTPSAVLLAADGTIASAVAVGGDALLTLAGPPTAEVR